MFAGRLEDPEAIDGVGLGLLCYNWFVFSVSWGMTGAIDTFVSQAYGQKKYYLWGTILNRAQIIMAILSIHQWVFLFFIGDIFIAFGQPERPAIICQEFIRYQLIGLMWVNQFEWVRRFLTAQGVYNVDFCIY